MPRTNSNPHSIPIPQPAGAAGGFRMHRQNSKSESTDEFLDRTKSEGDLGLAQPPNDTSMVSVQSERSLLSESEKLDTVSSLPGDGDSFNAMQMSKPIMTGGRRRPSQVQNLVSMIPSETRISVKDLLADEPADLASKPSSVFANPPSALSSTEQWLLDRLTQMERSYQERIGYLEAEVAILRAALSEASIKVASPPPKAEKASTTSEEKTSTTEVKAPASQPMPARRPPLPASPSLNRRTSSAEVSAGDRNSWRKSTGSEVAAALESPARKVPAIPGGARQVPEAPKEPAQAELIEEVQESEKESVPPASESSNPFNDSLVSANSSEKSESGPADTSLNSKAESGENAGEDDIDDDLHDML